MDPAHGESIGRADSGGVTEGEAAHLGVGNGSPGSREAEGESCEGFLISLEAAGVPIYSQS